MAEIPVPVVIVLKAFATAKSRLAGVIGPSEREKLARAMAGDMVEILAGMKEIGRIFVVTEDPAVADFADENSCSVFREPEQRGLSAAAGVAAQRLSDMSAASMLLLPGDLPRLSAGDIRTMISMHSLSPALTLAPDRVDDGTNAVLASPPGIIPFAFGPGSFSRHFEMGRAAGLSPAIVRRPGLSFDLDTPGDIENLDVALVNPRTGAFFSSLRGNNEELPARKIGL